MNTQDYKPHLEVVDKISKQLDEPLLETLEWCRDHQDELTHDERVSYRVVMRGFTALFHGEKRASATYG